MDSRSQQQPQSQQPQPQPQSQPQSQPQPQPQPQPQLQPQQRRRRRPALSCRECRRRKIKCDHSSPCAHCIRHRTRCIYQPRSFDDEPYTITTGPGQLSQNDPRQPLDDPGSSLSRAGKPTPPVCDYPPSPPQSTAPRLPSRTGGATLAPPLHGGSLHGGSLHGGPLHGSSYPPGPRIRVSPEATAAQSSAAPASSDHGDLRQSVPGHDPDDGLDLRDLLYRIQKLETSSAGGSRTGDSPTLNAPSEASLDSVARQSPTGMQEWRSLLSKSRDWGKSRWIGASTEYSVIASCYNEILARINKDDPCQGSEASVLMSQAGAYLRKCKNRARSIKVGRPTRGLPLPGFGLAPPPREMADAMATLYITSFESTHRILHIPTFWAEYQKFWDNPDDAIPSLRLMVLLVVGIGSSLYSHEDGAATLRNTQLVQSWIYIAQAWLSGPLEKDRLDITGLQVFCLTILARQIFSIGGDTVWISLGSLVNTAMQLGLHRDPKHLPVTSVLQAELRRRLWYTIVEFAVQSSLDAWMLPRISFDEFNTELPSNINDDELDESTTVLRPHPRDTFTSASVQLALIESLPARLHIVQLLNGLHTELPYSRVLSLSSDLVGALRKGSGALKEGGGSSAFHRNLLDYLARRFVIPLHYPFSNQPRTSPLSHYSRKLSLDAALALISPEPDGRFARLLATGGGLFREGMRSAAAAVILELLTHVETQRLSGTLRRTRHYRELLAQAVRDLRALAEERVRLGETNVKSHMFLSMALAQVDAVEAGDPVDLCVARAARDSLELCDGLLRTREDESAVPSPEGGGLGTAAGMEGVQELGMGPDFGWESLFPDAGFGQWDGKGSF